MYVNELAPVRQGDRQSIQRQQGNALRQRLTIAQSQIPPIREVSRQRFQTGRGQNRLQGGSAILYETDERTLPLQSQ